MPVYLYHTPPPVPLVVPQTGATSLVAQFGEVDSVLPVNVPAVISVAPAQLSLEGFGFTVTVVGADVLTQPFASVVVTV